jgi:hypothetical protein
MLFITGDVSEGSKNDALLREVIGPNWRELTGAEQPVLQKTNPASSPGYLHSRYWPMLMQRVKSLQEKERLAEGLLPPQPKPDTTTTKGGAAPEELAAPKSRESTAAPLVGLEYDSRAAQVGPSSTLLQDAARFAAGANALVDEALGDVSLATKTFLKVVVVVHSLLNYRSSRLIRYLVAWIIFIFVFMFMCIRDLPLCQEALSRGAAMLPQPRAARPAASS